MRMHRITIDAPQGDSDRGSALLLVMAWGLLMMGLALVVSQAVIQQIAPSDRTERSYAALAAAEAGIEDIEARLQVQSITTLIADPDNAALTGWVSVPGGDSEAEFTYAIDASKSGAVGEVRAFVTGRSGDVTRTIESNLSKRSTLDYVYMSDIETPSPDLPGAYSSTVIPGAPVGVGKTGQQVADQLCRRHWWDPLGGPVTYNTATGAFTNGEQRNLNFCQWAGIYDTERLVGRLHTNDVWRLAEDDLSDTIELGKITSSCPTEGDAPDAPVHCPEARRYIANNPADINSNNGTGATWTSATDYQEDTWDPADGTDGTDDTNRNPLYDDVLELPPSPVLLKQRASETGCVYTGPTRIFFTVEAEVGYMYVTSPDTKVTRPGCDGDGGTGTGLQSPGTAQVTRRITLSNFSDLVVFVQAVRRSSETDDPGNDFDLVNQWTSTSEPTCATKTTSKYPFVIPSDAGDQALFRSGTTYKGFPAQNAVTTSPWYGESCSNGDLYVQGSYMGALTLASEHNIVLTGSVTDSTADPDTGEPYRYSESTLGVVANDFAYIYRPFTSQPSTYTWASNKITVTYADHGFKVGDSVRFDFTSGGALSKDGTRTVASVPSTSTYTLTVTGSGTAGNVTVTGWAPEWRTDNAQDPKFNFALLAIDNCFASQDPYTAPRQGNIYLWGSIAQKFRCVVGSTGGYNKVYKYDERLTERTPPYMLELSNEPWSTKRYGEVNPKTQAVGATVTWPLLEAGEAASGYIVRNLRLTAFPGSGTAGEGEESATYSWPTGATSVDLTVTQPGMAVITYEAVKDGSKTLRRIPVLVE